MNRYARGGLKEFRELGRPKFELGRRLISVLLVTVCWLVTLKTSPLAPISNGPHGLNTASSAKSSS